MTRSTSPAKSADQLRLATLVQSLDCMTESDLLLLADINISTAEQWRKRGDGPAYIRAGNRYIYPRSAVAEWIAGRVRERKSVEPKGVL